MSPPHTFGGWRRAGLDNAMIPKQTSLLGMTAFVLILIWLWAWIRLDWNLKIAPVPTPAVSTVVPQNNFQEYENGEVDSSALLQSPAFYPDRRPHGFRPDAKDEPPAPAARMDFELTTTVVGRARAFAMLRLPGSNQSVIARAGEPFEADPSWRVMKIDKTSVSLAGNQGQLVTLTLKSPLPAQPPSSVPSPVAASRTQPMTTLTVQAPPAAPVAAGQPNQGDAGLRARIEARRRDAESRARTLRSQ